MSDETLPPHDEQFPPDDEEMLMIRDLINRQMPPDVAYRLVAWLDNVADLVAVLRKDSPDMMKELGF